MTPGLLNHFASMLGVAGGAMTARRAAGGDINLAFRLNAGAHAWFVKVNDAGCLGMFEAERQGLALIESSGAIRVPQVLACGVYDSSSYLLLEYIELPGRPEPERLARALAEMHRFQSHAFGNDQDNTIGLTPQKNAREENWVTFWRQHRIGYQLRLGRARGLDRKLLDRLESLQADIEYFFTDYQPLPSLLHGDLWSGNWSADSRGQPVIYDPACYFGDHEADLAMMELFGSPGESFFRAYHERFPIHPGYAERKTLYNLYHVVNHVFLFGGSYMHQAGRMVDRLLEATR